MQRFLSLFLALSLSLTFSLEASAKRLGSGTNSGSAPMHQTQSRSSYDSPSPASSPAASGPAQNNYGSTASTARSNPQTMQQPAAASRPSGMSRWLGPLAGLAAGGLLASMFMGDGFDGIQFFDILLLGLIAFGIFFLVRRMAGARRQDGLQPAAGGLGKLGNPVNYEEPKIQPLKPGKEQAVSTNIFGQPIDEVTNVRVAPQEQQQPAGTRTFDAPAWFDEQNFVEAGRKHFLELQQHWDAADMDKIATFVTPQMLEFLRKERAALGDGFQSTYIENLQVYLDGIEQQGGKTIATLSFEGVSKSSRFDQGEVFSESWRMERADGSNQPWLVAGIRQN